MNQIIYEDMDPEFASICNKCIGETMTSVERLYALYKAVRYITQARIAGDFVECGVWRGGSVMMMAESLRLEGETSRQLYLYDTFEGMPPPSEYDTDVWGASAANLLASSPRTEDSKLWAVAPIDVVKENLLSTNYPPDRFNLVSGRVENTLPAIIPDKIALLRLDTDWYESTLHELIHLYPRLEPGGVIIVDDYGHWRGARRAVDEYFGIAGPKILLNRIDYTGRIGVKI